MLVSIDKAGRVVIPKEIRERLDMVPGTELELEIDGNGVRLAPAPRPSRRVIEKDGFLVLEAVDGWTITDDDIQRWRDADQR